MKPSNFHLDYLRNSLNTSLSRKIYIPVSIWSKRKYLKPKPKKLHVLTAKEYKRIINIPKMRNWRPANMRATRKLMHRIRTIKPSYENIIFDLPPYLKEYFKAQMTLTVQPITVVTTDMLFAVNHFERIEDTYLSFLNKDKRVLLPSERGREALIKLIETMDNKGSGLDIERKLIFKSGIELLMPDSPTEGAIGLSPPNSWIEEAIDE